MTSETNSHARGGPKKKSNFTQMLLKGKKKKPPIIVKNVFPPLFDSQDLETSDQVLRNKRINSTRKSYDVQQTILQEVDETNVEMGVCTVSCHSSLD